ncbi:hypothetical protein KI387_036190, partial [Taxus chinensis]
MKSVGAAEGVVNLQPSSSIAIEYGKSFGAHDDLTLLEVDDTMLNHILDNRVTIRGNFDEEALLCTPSKTYAIKFVSTTNSVFLMPPRGFISQEGSLHNEPEKASAGVIKLAPGHMELTHVSPKLEILKFLLSQRPYKEETETESEMGNLEGLYRWEDFLETIQASEEELKQGLKSLAAVEIDGYWRIVDDKFMACLLDVLILNSVQHDWPLNALRAEVVLPVLEQDGYSNRLALHCLDTYGNLLDCNSESAKNGQGSKVWALNERLVCLHYAKQLLNAGRWKLDDFMEAWMQNLPSGMRAQMEMLRGEALVERFGAEMWVRPFSVSSLPANPADRFAALFRERPRWEWQDLEPYIR